MPKKFSTFSKDIKSRFHWLIIAAGTLVWSSTMVKSGLNYSFGMGFWGPNGHDGVWHLSLISGLSRFSLQMPVFAGETLRNYHFGFDLLLALLHLTTRIPARFLYFQILPPLFAAGIGIFTWKFMLSWTRDRTAAFWGLFFVYFGGSFGWLVSLFRGWGLAGESMFWAQQSISTLINPPFALSLLIIFFVLYRLSSSPVTNLKSQIILGFLIGSLALVKIYAALLFLPGLGMASIRSVRLRGLFLLSSFFALIFYLPFNSTAAGMVVFQPFWFVENMLALSDRFFWPRLFQAIQVYKTTHNFLKLIPAYGLGLTIFTIGNLGLRFLGFMEIRRIFVKNNPDTVSLILWTMAFSGFIAPLLFIQRGTPWNTIQFFYYTQFVMGLFTARYLARFADGIKKSYALISALVVSVVFFTLPTAFGTLPNYLPSRPPAMISRAEMDALSFLSRRPAGVVFTPPVRPDQYTPAPRPLYLYESTAYVSAFSDHTVFLEDTVNLNITGYDWNGRLDQSRYFMTETDPSAARSFLVQNGIRYIYLPQVSSVRPRFSAAELGGRVIYENSQVSIWEISPVL